MASSTHLLWFLSMSPSSCKILGGFRQNIWWFSVPLILGFAFINLALQEAGKHFPALFVEGPQSYFLSLVSFPPTFLVPARECNVRHIK